MTTRPSSMVRIFYYTRLNSWELIFQDGFRRKFTFERDRGFLVTRHKYAGNSGLLRESPNSKLGEYYSA